MKEEITNKLRKRIEEQLKKWDVPSASLCVVKDGETWMAEGIGHRDLEQGIPADQETLYEIASCTKAFTAAAVAVLATEGKLDMDKPVADYIPSFRLNDSYATEHLTIRDFLSHRSGLPRHEYAWYGTGFSREELMGHLKDLRLSAPIRYQFQYSNFNYLIAGALIEATSGMKFEDFLMERLLLPLGMTKSKVYIEDIRSAENKALPYDHTEEYTMEGIRRIDFYKSPAENEESRTGDPTAAAGCISSCAEDMARWMKFSLGDGEWEGKRLIRPDLMKLLFTPHMTVSDSEVYAPERSMGSYALGWQVYNYRGYTLREHGGNINGFTSETVLVPELGLGVFVSANMNVTLLADAITLDAVDLFLGKEDGDWYSRLYKGNEEMFASVRAFFASPGEKAVPDTKPSHALEDYVGEYETPGYRRVLIEKTEDRLRIDFNSFVVGLRHHHYDTFATEGSIGELPAGLLVSFGTSPEGEIKTVSMKLGSEAGLGPIVFTRK